MPDCWLEVSLHPEGPSTDQLDKGFQWFSLVPEQMLSWYPNSTTVTREVYTSEYLLLSTAQAKPPDGGLLTWRTPSKDDVMGDGTGVGEKS
jgi:hypothetical protein